MIPSAAKSPSYRADKNDCIGEACQVLAGESDFLTSFSVILKPMILAFLYPMSKLLHCLFLSTRTMRGQSGNCGPLVKLQEIKKKVFEILDA